MDIVAGDLEDPRIVALLRITSTARARRPPRQRPRARSGGLKSPDIDFWAIWHDQALLGVGALKRLSPRHGEVKSMHTAMASRRRGAGSAMLRHIIAAARAQGMSRLSLETGSWDFFRPARAFYQKHGFVACEPFGDYGLDPNSVFMTLESGRVGHAGDLTQAAPVRIRQVRDAAGKRWGVVQLGGLEPP